MGQRGVAIHFYGQVMLVINICLSVEGMHYIILTGKRTLGHNLFDLFSVISSFNYDSEFCSGHWVVVVVLV